MNWGEPTTWTRIFWHISGKQYSVWFLKSPFSLLLVHFQRFLQLWIDQFTPYLLPLGILGIFYIFKKSKGVGFLLLSIFLLNLFYGLNYDIPDIDAFFLPSFLITALWVGSGIFLLMEIVPKGISILFLFLPLIPLISYYGKSDKSRNWIAYDYGMNALRSIEENGICLTNNWDIYSPVLYIQNVEGRRKDVVMIDKELLRRSWYLNTLKREYPWLMRRSREEVLDYEEYLDQFERGTLKSPAEIQRRFIRMINSFIEKNLEERPVYTTFINGLDQDAPFIGLEMFKVPRGLAYQFQSASGEDSLRIWDDLPQADFSLRGAFDDKVYKDERTRIRLRDYSRMGFERGAFLFQRGRFNEALRNFQWTLRWDRENLLTRLQLGHTYLQLEEVEKAREEFQRVLAVDPGNAEARRGMERVDRKAGE